MNLLFFQHTGILLFDELSELFKRKKALIGFSLYILVIGGVIYGFSETHHSIEEYMKQAPSPKMSGQELLNHLNNFEGRNTLQKMMSFPITFVLFQFFALFWISELVILVSCDTISRDRSRGTLRFLFLRTSREAYYLSKFFAHTIIYTAIHLISLVLLSLTLVATTDAAQFHSFLIQEILYYGAALIPVIALSVALALFSSCLSRGTVSSLFKAHLLWFPILLILAYSPHRYFSWRTLFGVIAPFEEYWIANLVGYGSITVVVLLLGFLIFRRSEV